MNGESAKLLDTEVLDVLHDAIGDSIQRIIHLYIEEFPRDIQQMQQAVQTKDFATLERMAHSLKASSANLGAMQTSMLAAKLESELKSGETDIAHLNSAVQQLLQSFDQSRHLYSDYLANK